MDAFIHLIVIISSLLPLDLSQTVRLSYLDCFGCFGRRNHQTHAPSSVPTSIPCGFDNPLDRNRRRTINHSHAQWLSSHHDSPSLFREASMKPHLNETKSDIHAFDASITILSNVTWFDVDSHFITQNSTVIKSNMNIYLISMIMYDATNWLFRVGHYLPLNNRAIASQFQIIFDYFAQFQYGVKSVNLRHVVRDYESIRQKAITLLNHEFNQSESNLNIPTHVVDFDAQSSLSRIYKHRKRMRRAHLVPRTRAKRHSDDDKSSSTISTSTSIQKHFWNTDWLKWDKQPLVFTGLDRNETKSCSETLLLRVCWELDKVRKILTGYDNKGTGIHSMAAALRFRKAGEIILKQFWNESFVLRVNEYATRRFANQDPKDDGQKKLLFGLRQTFAWDIGHFVTSSILSTKQTKSDPKFKIQNSMGIQETQSFYLQMQFDAGLFLGYRGWKHFVIVVNQYLKDLLHGERSVHAVTYKNIQNRGSELYLLNVVLQHTLVGGRCGALYDEKNKGYQASIVCEVSVLDIDEDGSNAQINQRLKIPRKFMEKSNDYWVVLNNFTGLNFEDVDDGSLGSDSLVDIDGIMDGFDDVPRRKYGLTVKDLRRHNQQMDEMI
eukprot:901926_1